MAENLVNHIIEEAMTPENIERQRKREAEAVMEAAQRYKKKLIQARQHGLDLTTFHPEATFMNRNIESVASHIALALHGPKQGHPSYYPVMAFLKEIDPFELAYIGLKDIISTTSKLLPLQTCCVSLGRMIIQHYDYARWREAMPGYVHTIETSLNSTNAHHRHKVLVHSRNKHGFTPTQKTEPELMKVGYFLMRTVMTATGAFKLDYFTKEDKVYRCVVPTAEYAKELATAHNKEAITHVTKKPMVTPPVDWTGVDRGGYLIDSEMRRSQLVLTHDEDVIEAFRTSDLSLILKAVNAAQRVPWRINRRVLEVMEDGKLSGIGGLPSLDVKDNLPAKWWSTEDEFQAVKKNEKDRLQEWKRNASIAYNQFARETGKRKGLLVKTGLARKLAKEKAIWFVWNMDFRGRLYCDATPYLNPQSDDTGKALLEFAVGRRIGARGRRALAMHIANCFGVDKVSIDDRVAWVEENEAAILDSAENPMDGGRFWTTADKPYMALAACFEWQGVVRDGDNYVSHQCIWQDGSCSGLQHFSALLRDEVGGQFVNLLPGDIPADIYNRVAEVVIPMVEQDVQAGVVEATWLVDKIDRGLVKRPVMTKPYGATLFGYRDQILQELLKRDGKKGQPYLEGGDNYKAAVYLAKLCHKAIGQVVVKATVCMDWMQKIARRTESTLQWTSPIGLNVLQVKENTKLKRVRTFWGGTEVKMGLQLPKEKREISPNRMANAIAPNFVHSLDASHLMFSACAFEDNGINSFGFVHDSFGAHPDQVDLMNTLLRKAFRTMYERQDILADFRDEILMQLPPEKLDKVPAMPAAGTLDLCQVEESRYFFA